ncbi:RNase H family protein [Gordonia shandongensis]|uniref:RNase H family protein n=1 Tax=Gordonia shandongensis TaxID=376351 RepID=UPI00040C0EB2|nr:RNase H family protein [Gordonia shandongensis]
MYDEHAIDGTLLERRRWSCAPVEPTAEQVSAPVHVAFISWRVATGDPEWPRRLRWVVVVADRRTGARDPEVVCGQLERSDGSGWERIRHAVTDVIAGVSGPVWVAVPGRMFATARVLYEAGVPVTRGAADDNRAMARALEVIQVARAREIDRAAGHGPSNGVAASLSPGALDASDEGDPRPRREAVVPEWLPVAAEATLDPVDRLIVATDASVTRNIAAVAAVAAGGGYAIETSDTALNVSDSELDAISLSIERFASRVGTEFTIISDSRDAVTVADALIEDRVPDEGYRGIRDESLDRFVAAWSDVDCAVRILHVKGHAGHPLNEAADELAHLGRNAMSFSREQVEREFTARVEAVGRYVENLSDEDVLVPYRMLSPEVNRPMSWTLGDRSLRVPLGATTVS